MDTEPLIRIGSFAVIIITLAILEFIRPRRALRFTRRSRWLSNFGIMLIDIVLVRIFFPLAATGIALYAEQTQFGLLHWLNLQNVFTIVLSILFLDFIIYWQHRIFHAVPWLWRLHKVHHTDLEFDFTTAVRFHPIEIILSMIIKIAFIITLGLPPIAVLIFEILLNSSALFNHSNIHIPLQLDKWLRKVIVTPDMHRIHHSVYQRETDSNFGFNLSWWDRCFGSYCAEPKLGQSNMQIGLDDVDREKPLSLFDCIILPFKKHYSAK